jgi:CBS domain-containing protein
MRDLRAPQSCQPPPTPAIVEDVMRPQVTTVEAGAHVAAAAYLMNHAGATALMIRDGRTDQPIGIITQADIARAIARGKDATCRSSPTATARSASSTSPTSAVR